MASVFRLSLRQLGGRRRLLLVIPLTLIPLVLAAVFRFRAGDASGFAEAYVNSTLDGLIIATILPIVTMALATPAFGNELEDHTLSHLVLKPISRWRIALAKLLASIIICAPPLIVCSLGATVLGMRGGLQELAAVALALFLGVVAYASVFTWAGLMTTRALGFALVYVLLWEGVLSTFLGGIRYLSIRAYVLAVLHGVDETSFEALGRRVIEFPAALVGVVVVAVAFFWLTARRLSRMDVT
jgi:ABC-2 type transport system permease protein